MQLRIFNRSKNRLSNIMRKNGKHYYNEYTNNANNVYKELNNKLRHKYQLNNKDRRIVQAIKLVNFECKTIKPNKFYRGLYGDTSAIFDKFTKLNVTQKFDGITSTTLDYNIAKKYSEKGEYQVILILNVPADYNCFPILRESMNPNESEVIFYDADYVVKSYSLNRNKLIAKIDIVPKKEKKRLILVSYH